MVGVDLHLERVVEDLVTHVDSQLNGGAKGQHVVVRGDKVRKAVRLQALKHYGLLNCLFLVHQS